MARESDDLWQALLDGGEQVASEEDYEHGYAREVRDDLRRYVAFRVANELYGLPIHQIKEISKLFDTTPVPHTTEALIGIGNVRGTVVPVVDLPTRLRLYAASRSKAARILIVKLEGELHGLVVDEVLDVISIAPEELEEAPGAIGSTGAEFIAALGRYQNQILIILELRSLLDPSDFIERADAGSEGP